METFLRRNFKVEGNIASIYKPDDTAQVKLIEGIEVQLWHKSSLEKIFLAAGLTNTEGDFSIEFEVNSPVDYIVDGKISDVFLEAYYHGKKLEAYEPVGLREGLVAYWKLDELDGVLAADSTGNGHTATFSGANIPSWASGKINNGVLIDGDLDGSGNSFLDVDSHEDFNFGTGDFTCALWVNLTNTSGYATIFDGGYPVSGSFFVGIDVLGQIIISIGGMNIYTKAFPVNIGNWSYLVIRRINGELDVLVDGLSLGIELCEEPITGPSNLMIGKYSGGGQNFNGLLDEIGVWKGRGLTDLEIDFLYNNNEGKQYPFN